MSLEKPSIVRLFDDLADKVHRQYETIGLSFDVRAGSSQGLCSGRSGDKCVKCLIPVLILHIPDSIYQSNYQRWTCVTMYLYMNEKLIEYR